MMYDQETVRKLLPQKTPFVFVDRVLQSSETETLVELEIPKDGPCIQDGVFTNGGLLEMLAQGFILHCAAQQTDSNRNGVFLLSGVKTMEVLKRPKSGTVVTGAIQPLQAAFGMFLVKGTVYCENEVIFNATFSVTQK